MTPDAFQRLTERIDAMAVNLEVELSLHNTRIREHAERMRAHDAELKTLTEIAERMADAQRKTAEAIVGVTRVLTDHDERLNSLEGK